MLLAMWLLYTMKNRLPNSLEYLYTMVALGIMHEGVATNEGMYILQVQHNNHLAAACEPN